MEEHGRPDPDQSGDLPLDAGEGPGSQEADPREAPDLQEADPREPPDLQQADTGGPQEPRDTPGAPRDLMQITSRIPRQAATARGMRQTSPDYTEQGRDEVWDAYFERCEKRIDDADTDRYRELREIRQYWPLRIVP
jgi:hypothetical protein